MSTSCRASSGSRSSISRCKDKHSARRLMQFSGLCRLYSSVSLLALATALAAAFPRNEADHAEDSPERLTLRVGTPVDWRTKDDIREYGHISHPILQVYQDGHERYTYSHSH